MEKKNTHPNTVCLPNARKILSSQMYLQPHFRKNFSYPKIFIYFSLDFHDFFFIQHVWLHFIMCCRIRTLTTEVYSRFHHFNNFQRDMFTICFQFEKNLQEVCLQFWLRFRFPMTSKSDMKILLKSISSAICDVWEECGTSMNIFQCLSDEESFCHGNYCFWWENSDALVEKKNKTANICFLKTIYELQLKEIKKLCSIDKLIENWWHCKTIEIWKLTKSA